MAKQHAPALAPSSSPPSPHIVRHDLAKLVDRDPDTRRRAMDALKGYIQGELDVKSLPFFLEQISGESSKSDASRSHAISLFVEVARVHKQLAVPYIPRIMTTVVRSLPSSAVHQACAKVVSAVARYAIEHPTSGEEILSSLCHPLLAVLCSKVEPLAVGAATCLQALVESEKWKFAATHLERELCHRAAMALGERGTQTVAHMHLVRSLAKFNCEALQEDGAQLLRAGVDILLAAGGTCGSWQQRAAAAQLLGTLLPAVDEQTLASELVPTSEALERCRLDKITVVRQAIGEALSTAKSLTSEVEHMLQRSASQEVPTPPRRSSDPRKRGRRRSLWRREDREPPVSSTQEEISGSQESQLVSYAYSSSSSPPSLGSVSLASTASSATRIARSPLHPARQSPAILPSSTERYTAESELEFILAHLKSSESKENAPLMGKPLETAPSVRSDGAINLTYGNKGSKETGDDDGARGVSDDFSCDVEQERFGLLSEEHTELLHANYSDADVRNTRHGSFSSENAEAGFQRKTSDDHFPEAPDDRQESLDHPIPPEEKSHGTIRCTQSAEEPDRRGHSMSFTRYNSVAHLVNLEEVVSPQVPKTHMKAEDFLLFGTPRRLVRSLQSERSTPDSKSAPEGDSKEGLEIDFEELSESGWSVRDNPIAGDTEEDSPRKSCLVDLLYKGNMTATLECSPMRGLTSECADDMVVPQLPSFSANEAHLPVSADDSDMLLEAAPGRGRQLCVTDHLEEIAQDNLGEGEREIWPLRWLRQTGVGEPTVFARRLSKIHHYIEMFLGGALCAVLLFPMAIAVINCLNGREEIHVLVPT